MSAWFCRKRRRAPGARGAADDGYSLIELVVTLGLTALIFGLVAPLLGATSAAVTSTGNLERASAAGTRVIETIETEVGSASAVCLLAVGARTPVAASCPSPPVSGPADGAEVTTTAFSPGSPQVLQFWVSPAQASSPGDFFVQRWPNGAPQSARTSLVAGSSARGRGSCSIAPAPAGAFSLEKNASGTSLLTISITVTCGAGPGAASVPMSTTAAALNSAPNRS